MFTVALVPPNKTAMADVGFASVSEVGLGWQGRTEPGPPTSLEYTSPGSVMAFFRFSGVLFPDGVYEYKPLTLTVVGES
jgi:hypothetical protein